MNIAKNMKKRKCSNEVEEESIASPYCSRMLSNHDSHQIQPPTFPKNSSNSRKNYSNFLLLILCVVLPTYKIRLCWSSHKPLPNGKLSNPGTTWAPTNKIYSKAGRVWIASMAISWNFKRQLRHTVKISLQCSQWRSKIS